MFVQYTAFLILTPVLVAAYLSRWVDLFVILNQAVASIWYHSSHSNTSLFFDRLALSTLIVRTTLLALTNNVTIGLFFLGFGYMFVMYIYGFYNQCFSFDPRPEMADLYHASIHVVGIAIYTGSMICFL